MLHGMGSLGGRRALRRAHDRRARQPRPGGRALLLQRQHAPRPARQRARDPERVPRPLRHDRRARPRRAGPRARPGARRQAAAAARGERRGGRGDPASRSIRRSPTTPAAPRSLAAIHALQDQTETLVEVATLFGIADQPRVTADAPASATPSSACLAVARRAAATTPSGDEPGEELSGGDTTVFDQARNAFSLAARNLEGRAAGPLLRRQRDLQPATGSPRRRRPTGVDGLGPTFNATSCSACHFKDGRGAPPASAGEEFLGLLLRLSDPGRRTSTAARSASPTYGGQLNHHAILGVPAEGSPQRHATTEVPGHVRRRRRRTRCAARRTGSTASRSARSPPDAMISPRVAPVDDRARPARGGRRGRSSSRSPTRTTPTATASPAARTTCGIRRRGPTTLGRFGWKANQPGVAAAERRRVPRRHRHHVVALPRRRTARRRRPRAPRAISGGDARARRRQARRASPTTRGCSRCRRAATSTTPTCCAARRCSATAGCASCHVPTLVTGDRRRAPRARRTRRSARTPTSCSTTWATTLADGRPDFVADGQRVAHAAAVGHRPRRARQRPHALPPRRPRARPRRGRSSGTAARRRPRARRSARCAATTAPRWSASWSRCDRELRPVPRRGRVRAARARDDLRAGPARRGRAARDGPRELASRSWCPTLDEVALRAGAMADAARALADAPSQATLDAAQDAWRAARVPWKETEAFAFGPATTERSPSRSIRSRSSRPRSSSSSPAPAESTDLVRRHPRREPQGLPRRRVPAVRGDDDAAVLASLTTDAGAPRRREWPAALARGDRARRRPPGDRLGARRRRRLRRDGRPRRAPTNPTYPTIKAVDRHARQRERVPGRARRRRAPRQAARTATGGAPRPELEESGPSDNSLDDLAAAVRGIRNVYSGSRDGTPGGGIGALVAARSPATDRDVREALDTALAAIAAIPPPLRRRRSSSSAPRSQAAYDAVKELKRILGTEVVGRRSAPRSSSTTTMATETLAPRRTVRADRRVVGRRVPRSSSALLHARRDRCASSRTAGSPSTTRCRRTSSRTSASSGCGRGRAPACTSTSRRWACSRRASPPACLRVASAVVRRAVRVRAPDRQDELPEPLLPRHLPVPR